MNAGALADVRAAEPLAFVLGPVFQDSHLPIIALPEAHLILMIVVDERTELLTHFLKLEQDKVRLVMLDGVNTPLASRHFTLPAYDVIRRI